MNIAWSCLALLLASPPYLPLPDGWRHETIPFPLEFAPSLPYRGEEELRFAPGMFKRGAEDYWSYVFVWSLEGDVTMTAARLNTDLKTYFEGLSRAVEKKEAFDAVKAAVTSGLTASSAPSRFLGTVSSYDPFVTHERLELNVRVDVRPCPGRTAVIFRVSPRPATSAVWRALDQVADGFACSAPEAPPPASAKP